VRCDESILICIRCQRPGRECTGPLTGVQFVDTGDNVKERAGAAGAMVIFQVVPSRNHWFPVDQPAGNGNLYQKWHRSSVGPSTLMHAGATLLVERMIAVLKAEDMVPDSCGAEMMDPAKCVGVEHCQLDIKTLCLHIWISHEHARSARPMAAQYMF
jgi:hypothetical protein